MGPKGAQIFTGHKVTPPKLENSLDSAHCFSKGVYFKKNKKLNLNGGHGLGSPPPAYASCPCFVGI